MKIQDLVQRFVELGLSKEEAQVYVHLNASGALKASDVASAINLPRPKAYRILQGLMQRGYLTMTLHRPTRFEAAPPEKLFAEALATQHVKAESIRRAQADVALTLTTLRRQTEPNRSKNRFKILQGRKEALGVMGEMLRSAGTEVRILATPSEAVSSLETAGILDALMERAGEGLKIRAVLALSPALKARIGDRLEVPNFSYRILETEGAMRYIVVDGRELLMWAVVDESNRLSADQDVAIWTDAADFVLTQGILFDALWKQAQQEPPVQKVTTSSRT